MYRVTTGMLKDTMLYNLNTANRKQKRIQNQIATGKKAAFPHQDPSGVVNSMLYKSRLTELSQFKHNIQDGDSRLKFYDAALESTSDILLRLKELSVQAANGTYNANDRKIASREVDQLLHQMIEIANTRYKGETIFSGFKTNEVPFKTHMEKVEGWPHALVNRVEYKGDIGQHKREIEQLQYVDVNMTGNTVFWGENMTVSSTTPGTDYRAPNDQTFRIDGEEIQVSAGDTLPMVVQKINDSHIAVQASIDNTRGTNLLVLEATDPHQLWVEDIRGGTVMQDLGLIARGSNTPPKNFSATARIDGGSMFDQVIEFRNALLENDLEGLGSGHMESIDRAIKHISRHRGELGALSARLDSVNKRLHMDEVHMTDVLSKTEDVNMAEAMTELKMSEFVKKSAMQIGGRVIPATLLDFLR